MEDLVTDKVDAFWKAMENGSNKRGQVSARACIELLNWNSMLDCSLNIRTEEKARVVCLPWRGGRTLGTLVCITTEVYSVSNVFRI